MKKVLRMLGRLSCSLMAMLLAVSATAAPAKENGKAVTKQEATAVSQEPQASAKPLMDITALPKSFFTLPATTDDGRDPFYPRSARATVAKEQAKPTTLDPSMFVLNGITGPPLRSAMINGRTFLKGEEGEIRMPSGLKVMVRCTDIGDERAVIEVGGVRRELKFRMGI